MKFWLNDTAFDRMNKNPHLKDKLKNEKNHVDIVYDYIQHLVSNSEEFSDIYLPEVNDSKHVYAVCSFPFGGDVDVDVHLVLNRNQKNEQGVLVDEVEVRNIIRDLFLEYGVYVSFVDDDTLDYYKKEGLKRL